MKKSWAWVATALVLTLLIVAVAKTGGGGKTGGGPPLPPGTAPTPAQIRQAEDQKAERDKNDRKIEQQLQDHGKQRKEDKQAEDDPPE